MGLYYALIICYHDPHPGAGREIAGEKVPSCYLSDSPALPGDCSGFAFASKTVGTIAIIYSPTVRGRLAGLLPFDHLLKAGVLPGLYWTKSKKKSPIFLGSRRRVTTTFTKQICVMWNQRASAKKTGYIHCSKELKDHWVFFEKWLFLCANY